MATNVMEGRASLSIWRSNSDYVTIPSTMLSEIAAEFTEGTRSRETLGGTFTTPSGNLDTAQITGTIYLPNMAYLGKIFSNLYNIPSGTEDEGNIVIGGTACVAQASAKVNVHFECEGTDNNDLHIFSALFGFNFNATYNATDPITVEFVAYAQPTNDGVARFGTGDLTEKSVYNPATGQTDPYTT